MMVSSRPIFSFLLAGFLSVSSAPAQSSALSEGDRQALLERLREIQEGAESRIKKLRAAAYDTFGSAAQDEAKTHDLYLNCVEKVQFGDEETGARDFREWKRQHKERTDTKEFRRALRHQLRWLLLCMEVGDLDQEEDRDYASRVLSTIDGILADEDLGRREVALLKNSVGASVFAQAYEIEMPEEWPTAPLNLKTVYEEALLPPLRGARNADGFRNAWARWISQEARLLEILAGDEDEEQEEAQKKFYLEDRPQMLWELEKEIFEMGDERGAALAMLKHLDSYRGHPKEEEWTEEFLGMLQPTVIVE
ncbi:hypothetical protein [Roseibacillus ishigakijimensis]|uniref:Secreted protein n=1 Tax=Roseibacillus ishigakijimensis TaxID=454146 RepID=A0A934RUC6_9BACT|nr:hypothetical protein [Roseibacillus ishigakijimensis]MBK1834330.1 hypothetical protein [Roseibacillus ishigakijimensis]